ncbi:MAG: TnpV protein [Clostridia bacterium]|nr:TnpV protein [Clostridia bacterium]
MEPRKPASPPLQREFTENNIRYTLHGDYYFPDILDPKLEEQRPIGRWGQLHEQYLKEHRPGLYTRLILSGTLYTVLADLNEAAENRLAQIISDMKRTEGITEALKGIDQLEWVRRMNSIRSRAEEIILAELIYV